MRVRFDRKEFLITISIAVLYIGFLIYWNSSDQQKIFVLIGQLALLAGLHLEFFRVSKSWHRVLMISIVAFIFSLLSLGIDLMENWEHLDDVFYRWPYFISGFFILNAIIEYAKQVTLPYSDKDVMVFSLLFFYWCIDPALIARGNLFVFLACAALSIAFIITMNSLFVSKLTNTVRILSSVWITLLLVFLCIQYLVILYYQDLQSTELSLGDYFLAVFQYFLLGISGIYAAQNFLLIFFFVPGGKNDEQERKKLIASHLERLSPVRTPKLQSMLIIGSTILICGLNFTFNFADKNVVIWGLIALTTLIGKRPDLKQHSTPVKPKKLKKPEEDEEEVKRVKSKKSKKKLKKKSKRKKSLKIFK
ncbi:MAG: hypothetical protein ACI837_003122 [Crocinitomicaceae bacterium]|jgi:hypothetical protein